jgi:hypothetical protein
MKKRIIFLLAAASAIFYACNNNAKKDEQAESENKMDSAQHVSPADDKVIKAVSVTFTNVDAKVAASIKEIVSHYLHVKNALANDNEGEATNGAKAMEKAISGVDKSYLTSDQKKVYDGIEEDLKEHAEHIGKSKIDHQRGHFSMMSEDIYNLVKAFGGGQTLYHDHCAMANDNKGAMWLSETVDIKNPYMGSKMPKCGTVEEVIK